MNQIKERNTLISKSINIKNLEMTVEVDGTSVDILATITFFGEWLGYREINTAIVKKEGIVLGTICEGEIYIAVDSNGINKIDKEDLSWKILNLLKEEFKTN